MTELTAERRFARTVDGFESQFATNYVGPFVLTGLVLPHITDRVVTVSSQLHRMGKVHLDDLNGENRAYKASAAYNDSKLADVLFARELQHRLDAAGNSYIGPRGLGSLKGHPAPRQALLGCARRRDRPPPTTPSSSPASPPASASGWLCGFRAPATG